jgi:butyryl-CoA dehydrogenase
MDFELTEDQKLLQSTVREFAEEVVRPGAARIDQSGEFPKDIFQKAGELASRGSPSRSSTAARAWTSSPIPS